jgi:hypothetical protein
MRKKLDIQPGMKFGRLSIVKEVEPKKYPSGERRKFECLCDCGNQINVFLIHLRSDNTKSCGCFRSEYVAQKNYKHGLAIRNNEHYLLDTWGGMKQRCYNPKHKSWKNYGGRGITICDRWLNSVENFIEDMGKRPSLQYSIDRIDNNGNYELSNCRWATKSEQRQNQRNNKKNDLPQDFRQFV